MLESYRHLCCVFSNCVTKKIGLKISKRVDRAVDPHEENFLNKAILLWVFLFETNMNQLNQSATSLQE